jgi:hypothetical protein
VNGASCQSRWHAILKCPDIDLVGMRFDVNLFEFESSQRRDVEGGRGELDLQDGLGVQIHVDGERVKPEAHHAFLRIDASEDTAKVKVC